jgi:hypothetical protein
VIAGRVAGLVSGGPYSRLFAVGGESGSSVVVVPGLGFGAGFRDFGLRGYPPSGSRFTRAFVSTAEVRVPLFLIGKAIWRLPLALDRVSLAAFGEAGGGWTMATAAKPTQLRDAGAELVLDLGVGPDFPVRARVGGAEALTSGLGVNKGAWRSYVAIGSAF